MRITSIRLQNFRVFDYIELTCRPGTNIIHGVNGSGKSTIFEALSLFSHGRSFVAHNHKALIRFGSEAFTAKLDMVDELDIPHKFTFHFSDDGVRKIKLDDQKCQAILPIVKQFPAVYLTPQSFSLLEGSAKDRRNFIDWLGFYTKPCYAKLLGDTRKLLVHRNQALRSKQRDADSLIHWSEAFAKASIEITNIRKEIVTELLDNFYPYLQNYLPGVKLELSAFCGWNQNVPLIDLLGRQTAGESNATTQHGSHRFDLHITHQGSKAAHVFSRGEKKRIVLSMYFSLLSLAKKHQVFPLLVIDDLASELDRQGFDSTLAVAQQLSQQVFVSTIHRPEYKQVHFLPLPVEKEGFT